MSANEERLQAVALYARRRTRAGHDYLREMLADPPPGATVLTPAQRRRALRTDATLRRLGVRCLWRSAVVTEVLRDQGVAARIGLSVSKHDPRRAHAECEVDGTPLRPHGTDAVRLG
jgi:hypothetical protein